MRHITVEPRDVLNWRLRNSLVAQILADLGYIFNNTGKIRSHIGIVCPTLLNQILKLFWPIFVDFRAVVAINYLSINIIWRIV